MEINYAALTMEGFCVAEVLKTKSSWLCLKQLVNLVSENIQHRCFKNLRKKDFLFNENIFYKDLATISKCLASKSIGLCWILL